MGDTYSAHKEPVLCNCFGIEEEFRTCRRLAQEVRSKGCNPFENREPGSRFKYEKGNRLLKEQPDNDSGPPEQQSLAVVQYPRKSRLLTRALGIFLWMTTKNKIGR